MEEVESISTTSPVFSAYLGIAEALLEHQGNLLYVGPVLDRLGNPDALRRRLSRVQPVEIPTYSAARMFHLNLQTWKSHSFIKDSYPAASIGRLERDLEALAGDPGGHGQIEWGLRQLVFERLG
jgi:hypothetical protein